MKKGTHLMTSKQVLDNFNAGVKTGESRMLGWVMIFIDGHKEVYAQNTPHWPPPEGYAEGDEVEEADSEHNETCNFLIKKLEEWQKEVDATPIDDYTIE